MQKNKYKKRQIIILFALLICFISLAPALARYITENISDFFIRSKEFYFYSDKLSENLSIYQIDNWSGVDDYTIVINMNSYENNLKTTSYDIDYDISYKCSSNAICQLSKQTGSISASRMSDTFTVTVTPNTTLNTGDRVIVEITATSKTGYTKTLEGRFTLVVGKENLSYEITDSSQSPYMELRITNTMSYYIVQTAFDGKAVGDKIDVDAYLSLSEENKAKCYSSIVSMQFNPQEVLLDMTNETFKTATNVQKTTIDGIAYISGFTIKIDAISSVNIRFYKTDVTQDYTYPNAANDSKIQITSI